MRKNAGKGFDMMKDKDILEIDSPRKNVYGPWYVVYKNVAERWAIVVLHWKNDGTNHEEPRLGIRWFYGNQGTPSVRTYATWLIIPPELADGILNMLPIDSKLRKTVNDILTGQHTVDELKKGKK